jgi:DNA-binding GntR family transcriptional regulator
MKPPHALSGRAIHALPMVRVARSGSRYVESVFDKFCPSIIQATLARDADRAASLMDAHLATTEQALRAMLAAKTR